MTLAKGGELIFNTDDFANLPVVRWRLFAARPMFDAGAYYSSARKTSWCR